MASKAGLSVVVWSLWCNRNDEGWAGNSDELKKDGAREYSKVPPGGKAIVQRIHFTPGLIAQSSRFSLSVPQTPRSNCGLTIFIEVVAQKIRGRPSSFAYLRAYSHTTQQPDNSNTWPTWTGRRTLTKPSRTLRSFFVQAVKDWTVSFGRCAGVQSLFVAGDCPLSSYLLFGWLKATVTVALVDYYLQYSTWLSVGLPSISVPFACRCYFL